MISLALPDRLVRGLRQRACRAFPNEYACFILGRRTDAGLEVTDLWHPPMRDLLDNSGRFTVTLKKQWLTQAMEAAAAKKCIVIGNIHTHTYRRGESELDPIQSIGDLEAWQDTDLVAGVFNVAEQKNGRKRCGPIAFYGPTQLVDVELK